MIQMCIDVHLNSPFISPCFFLWEKAGHRKEIDTQWECKVLGYIMFTFFFLEREMELWAKLTGWIHFAKSL